MAQGKSYVYVIERGEDGSYWAYLPDLPGCATSGETAEEVEGKLPEAVELYLIRIKIAPRARGRGSDTPT